MNQKMHNDYIGSGLDATGISFPNLFINCVSCAGKACQSEFMTNDGRGVVAACQIGLAPSLASLHCS